MFSCTSMCICIEICKVVHMYFSKLYSSSILLATFKALAYSNICMHILLPFKYKNAIPSYKWGNFNINFQVLKYMRVFWFNFSYCRKKM